VPWWREGGRDQTLAIVWTARGVGRKKGETPVKQRLRGKLGFKVGARIPSQWWSRSTGM
jgi:hypothetical protein